MALKLSELNTTVSGLRSQVEKIWVEQQGKYDALVIEFNTLKEQLENVEVPADVETALTDFATRLKEFDDTIPDTTPEPPVEPA